MLFPSWLRPVKARRQPRAGRRNRRGRVALRLEVLEDRSLPSAYVVTTTADGGPGSLRDAINQVNADTAHLYASPTNPGVDEIDFAITAASDTGGGYNAATGVATITPLSALPALTAAVFVNGQSQPGFAGSPLVEVNGELAGAGADGLDLTGGGSTVAGLVVNRFAGPGLLLEGGGGNTVAGNYLGTDPTGTLGLANGVGLLVLNSADNVIGGTALAARNVLSGNAGDGVELEGGGATGNVIEGNLIGTNAAGTAALPNGGNGVGLSGAAGNVIGGTAAGAGNGLAGNGLPTGFLQNGFGLPDPAQTITFDEHALPAGTQVTNQYADLGVTFSPFAYSSPPDATVDSGQGPHLDATNVGNFWPNVAANDPFSIHFTSPETQAAFALETAPGSATFTALLGGQVVATATAPTGYGPGSFNDFYGFRGITFDEITIDVQTQDGALILDNLQVGRAAPAGGVTLGNGVELDGGAAGNVIEGNAIGTGPTGTALGNLGAGVSVSSSPGNTVGGTAAGSANVLAFTRGPGVAVTGATAAGTAVLGNSIHDNGGPGISLDGATGANHNQAAPVLTDASVSGGGTTVSGTLTNTPGHTFRIEFFANAAPDPSGSGDGQTFLGAVEVTTDSTTGSAAFTAALPGLPAGQDYLSATATDLTTNDTSAFGRDGLPAAAAVSPSSATAAFTQPVTFTATVGPADAGLLSLQGGVDFVDTTTDHDLGTATLSGGAALLTVSLGAGTHIVQAVYGGDGTFLGTSAATTVTVSPATPTVTVTDAGGTYDGQAFAATATVAGVVVGVDDTPAASPEGVSPTLSYYRGTYTDAAQLAGLTPLAGAPTDAGDYTVLASFAGSADYTGATAVANFTIGKADQTITWATPAPITYGTPLGSAQLNAAVSVVGPAPAGALTYSPAAGTVLGPGPQTLTVTAAATADYNAATASVTLQVNDASGGFTFSGFLPPLACKDVFRVGQTIPIKFKLWDANGSRVTDLAAVTSLEVAPVVAGVVGTPFTPDSAGGQGLQYTHGHYQFNWQTQGLAAGTYQIQLTLADGTVQTDTLRLKGHRGGKCGPGGCC
jgi:hypothetical protein